MNALIIIGTLLLVCALQARLPVLWSLGGLRVELLPAVVVYASLTLRQRGALFLAITAGFGQDALSAAPFGLSALVYGVAALVITSMRNALDRELPWVQMIAAALTAGASSLAACCVVGFSAAALAKVLVLVLISGLIAPLIFVAADWLRVWGRTT